MRALFLIYGSVVYAFFLGTFLYSIGFFANAIVPVSIDSVPATGAAPVGTALLINLGLLSLFAVQHSGMARAGFKRWWTRIVPEPIERSTYVLLSTVVLVLTYAFWQPLPVVVWNIETPLLRGITWAAYLVFGWGLVLYSTWLIDHFDLFGLRQVIVHFKQSEYGFGDFVTPSLYRFVRHPLYVGWFCVLWLTPTMTAGHLLFAAVASSYVLIAIQLEERDLVGEFGDAYRQYQQTTPSLIPIPRRAVKPVTVPIAN